MRLRLIQAADGPVYPQILRRAAIYHSHYAKALGYDYLVNYDPSPSGRHSYWRKVELTVEAIAEGFDRVVWLDADAFWLGGSLDEAFAFPTEFGMTRHWHPDPDVSHYNDGVYFYQHLGTTVVQQWLDAELNGLNEQVTVNAMFSDRITEIDHKWNSTGWIPLYRSPHPRILAWHGAPDRINKMNRFLDSLRMSP